MTEKDIYRTFCEEASTIPVFSQPWWLDATCRKGVWDVSMVRTGHEIQAAMPYYMPSPSRISMPILTQSMGPWLRPAEGKHATQLSRQKQLMTTLIQQLPPVRQFNQHFHYSITNWLPFYWKGFQQTTRYTYVIDDLSDLDLVFDDFSRAKKKNIRKARKTVDIKWDLSATEFYDNHRYTLKKSNAAIVYSRDIFNRLYEAGYARNQGRTIWAADGEGRIHAALFVVWDRMSAYDLISTIDPDLRNSGAASLLVWEMIKYIKEQQGLNRFDFEGSMIEGVENSFRQFGAAQYRYFHIYRDQRHGYEKLITRMLQYARCRLRFLKHGFKQTET